MTFTAHEKFWRKENVDVFNWHCSNFCWDWDSIAMVLHYFANFFNITTGLFCPGDINKEAFFKLLSMSINIEQRHKEMGMLNEYEIWSKLINNYMAR